jgi:hydroxyacyl-ACP dehydratase HTD2-like protein with hotdog domain
VTSSTDGPVPAGDPRGSGAHTEEPLGRFTLDAVSLFLFSAACGLTHRIHYDEGYARSEGFDGLPVQGPLQGALIAQVFQEMARQSGRRLAALQIRHVSPAYAGQEFRLIQAATRPAADTEEIGFRLETSSGTAVAVGTISLAPGAWPT